MTQRNKYSLIEFQLLHIFFLKQSLLLREWRRLITKRDWPVLIKLWTGKMNIEIKFHISFQITVNISGKKTHHLSGQSFYKRKCLYLSDLIVIDQKSKAKKH